MKKLKSHLKLNKQEQSGIFFLVLLIVIAFGFYFGLKWFGTIKPSNFKLDEVAQAKIDSLKAMHGLIDSVSIFPFNPNYISDYKGYTLGMSPDEINRLHNFRKLNRYVNSAEEFQGVTKVSDSLLGVISPYFKFPDWVNSRKSKIFKKSLKKNLEAHWQYVI